MDTKNNSILKKKKLKITLILLTSYILSSATPILAYYDRDKIKFQTYTKIKTSFDDNISFTKNNKKDDTIITSSVGININYEGKKYSFIINSLLNKNVFLNNTSLTNTSQQAKLNYLYYISKYSTLILQNIYNHAYSPLTLEADFGKYIGRYGYQQNNFYLNYIKDISKHLSIQGMYKNIYYHPAKNDINNSLTHNIGIGLDYMINSATTLKLQYTFEINNFSIDGTSLTHTITAGLRQFITKQAYIDITAGTSIVNPVYGKTNANPNISVAITDDISKTDSIIFIYNKTALPNAFSSDIFDSWKITAKINSRLTDKVSMNAGIFYGEGVFTKNNTKDHQTGANIKINYTLTRKITGFIAYTYKAIHSNNDSREYTRNLIELGIQVIF